MQDLGFVNESVTVDGFETTVRASDNERAIKMFDAFITDDDAQPPSPPSDGRRLSMSTGRPLAFASRDAPGVSPDFISPSGILTSYEARSLIVVRLAGRMCRSFSRNFSPCASLMLLPGNVDGERTI